MPQKNHIILYIDDDTDDLQMLQDAVQSVDKNFHLVEATNGIQGLSRLNKMKMAGELPCLIVLDINMPGMNGKETFKHIKSDDELTGIPVVIFSTSSNEKDRSFFQGDNVEYIMKPVNFSYLVKVAQRLLDYCRN